MAQTQTVQTKDIKQLLQPVRGTQDFLPAMARRMRHIEQTALDVFARYGYGEIKTPIFEFTELFARNVGEKTDIVSKEMYTFPDRGGESLTLKPEGTAPVVRAYYTHGLKQELPLKLCYAGAPTFRYERPQKGRFRQHHQIGAELFGVDGPLAEIEMLSMMIAILKALGIDSGLYVSLNSLGDKHDRARYREALVSYFSPHKEALSKDSQERLMQNPLRILDSKDEGDKALVKEAPKPADFLHEETAAHFENVKKGLDNLGVPWQLDPNLVRGLDYYSHTVFEVHSSELGAQSQILSGGRYNYLIEQMGGHEVPAIGFGGGMERLEALMPELPEDHFPIAMIAMGQAPRLKALQIAERLRGEGVKVALSLDEASFKNQLKKAHKMHAPITLICGEDELQKGILQVKNMATGEQQDIPFEEVVAHIKAFGV